MRPVCGNHNAPRAPWGEQPAIESGRSTRSLTKPSGLRTEAIIMRSSYDNITTRMYVEDAHVVVLPPRIKRHIDYSATFPHWPTIVCDCNAEPAGISGCVRPT